MMSAELSFEAAMRIVKLSEMPVFLEIKDLSPEELAQAYALSKAAFTAEDLQRFTEVDEGIPMEPLLQELEEAQRQLDQGTTEHRPLL
jgi:hypothetical protein